MGIDDGVVTVDEDKQEERGRYPTDILQMIDYKISRAEILLKELKSNERPLTNPEKNILENLF